MPRLDKIRQLQLADTSTTSEVEHFCQERTNLKTEVITQHIEWFIEEIASPCTSPALREWGGGLHPRPQELKGSKVHAHGVGALTDWGMAAGRFFLRSEESFVEKPSPELGIGNLEDVDQEG